MKTHFIFNPAAFTFLLFTSFLFMQETTLNQSCDHSISSTIQYHVQKKKVQGSAFSNSHIISSNKVGQNFEKGLMEICSSNNKACRWTFGGNKGKEFSLETPGFEELVKALYNSSSNSNVSIDQFIKQSQVRGATVKKIGTATICISEHNKATDLTIVTVIDTNRKVILGSSIYKNDNELQSKLICDFKQVNNTEHIDSMTLLSYEHEVGQKEGWVVEVVVKYI